MPCLFVPLDAGATRDPGTDVTLGAVGLAEGGGTIVLSGWRERRSGKTGSSAEGVGGDGGEGVKVSGVAGVDRARQTTPRSVTTAAAGLPTVPSCRWPWETDAVSTP